MSSPSSRGTSQTTSVQSQPGERGQVEWRLLHLSMQHNLPRKWRIRWEWQKIWIRGLAKPEPSAPTNCISVNDDRLEMARKLTRSELPLVCPVYPWLPPTSCWGKNGRERGQNKSDAPSITWTFTGVERKSSITDRKNSITTFSVTFHLDVVEAPLLDLFDNQVRLHQPGKNRI